MWTRSYWVLMTYVKRPSSWLIAAAMVATSIVLYCVIDEKQHGTVHNVLHGEVVRTFAQLDSVLDSDPSQPVELDYGGLYSEATRQVFPYPRSGPLHIGVEEQAAIHSALKPVERLTNVESLAAGYAVDQATIERIAEFRTLKRLSSFVDLGYDTLDLQPLTNLHELEELQFGVVSRVASLEPLSELPKLEKLAIGSPFLRLALSRCRPAVRRLDPAVDGTAGQRRSKRPHGVSADTAFWCRPLLVVESINAEQINEPLEQDCDSVDCVFSCLAAAGCA